MRENCIVGVVTVTYNSASVLDEFLASMASQKEDRFRLYVVDNASRDASLEQVSRAGDPRTEVIANRENLGVAEGNNQGIVKALEDGCEWVCLLNNDTVFGPDLLATLLEEAERMGVPMLVPKMMYHDRPDRIWCAGGKFNRARAYGSIHFGDGEQDRGQYDAPRDVEYTPTCCMLIHSSVFRRIGLMDETYFVYNDDNDFCLRAKQAGIRLAYTPRTRLFHKVSSLTGGKLSDFSIYYGTRNRAYYVRKLLPKALAFYYLILAEIYFLALLAARKETWKTFCLRQKAHLDGIRLEPRPPRPLPS